MNREIHQGLGFSILILRVDFYLGLPSNSTLDRQIVTTKARVEVHKVLVQATQIFVEDLQHPQQFANESVLSLTD